MLYKQALTVAPTSASYALNLVHDLEVCNKYQQAFVEFKKFFADNAEATLVSTATKQLSCKEMLSIIERVDDIYQHAASRVYHPETPLSESDIDFVKTPVNPYEVVKGTADGETLLEYSPDSLDLLALFCTLVKVIYIVGALDLIPLLAERIGNFPLRFPCSSNC